MRESFLYAFPPGEEIETKAVLKRAAIAHQALAELKGVSQTIPNQEILLNTLSLQEAKDSSAIENIITTHDELFKSSSMDTSTAATKEVRRYALALQQGYALVKETNMITTNHIIQIHSEIEGSRTGFRQLPGTALINDRTGEIIYTPPQSKPEIQELMNRLELFINDDKSDDLDPLVKMALIHYQFESIHPFYDGNGRTGRLINILYLVLKGLLDIPVLYLSRYIIQNKDEYYRLLVHVRTSETWEEWILFLLSAVEQTSRTTIRMIQDIKQLMMDYKHGIRKQFAFYSQDLLNNLFMHPYTKIEFVERDLKVSRPTAAKYLEELVVAGFLSKSKIGRSNYYINVPLYKIFDQAGTST
jgi:Fic family protein